MIQYLILSLFFLSQNIFCYVFFIFQDIGVGHVSDGLYEQNLDQGLNTLVLWNNQMSYQAMSAISKALVSRYVTYFCLFILYPRSTRGGVYCFTSVCPSVRPKYFSSHFSQQLLI